MGINIKRYFLLCCLLCSCLLLAAQNENVPYDSIEDHLQEVEFTQEEILDKDEPAPIVLRRLPADTMQAIASRPQYGYMRYIDSLLRANNKAVASAPKSFSGSPVFSRGWIRGILWAAAIIALLVIAYQIFQNQRQLFVKNQRLPSNDEPLKAAEGPHRQQRLQQAIAQQNFRLATRYLFIDTLALLAEKGHLTMLHDKTNQQYFSELQEGELKKQFAHLMLHYEYVWYGEFLPTPNQFNTIRTAYQQFHQSWL